MSYFSPGAIKKIKRALPRPLQKRLPAEIRVVEVSKKESWRLNWIYRGKNKPANVLSFRYGPDYSEIIICPSVIRKEAKKYGNSYRYQLRWMIAHGLLHLAGLHHERSPKARKKFEQIEQKILKRTTRA